MNRQIHRDFDTWLTAAVRGTLTAAERLEWEQHLAACPDCMHRLESPETVALIIAQLSARQPWDSGFEQRLAAGFRDAIAPPEGRLSRFCALVSRQRYRVVIALVIGLLLVVRSLNVQFVTDAFAGGAELSALWQGALRAPHYRGFMARGNALINHDVFLATVHKLTSLYVETFLIALMLLAVGLVILDVYRRRRVLAWQ